MAALGQAPKRAVGKADIKTDVYKVKSKQQGSWGQSGAGTPLACCSAGWLWGEHTLSGPAREKAGFRVGTDA